MRFLLHCAPIYFYCFSYSHTGTRDFIFLKSHDRCTNIKYEYIVGCVEFIIILILNYSSKHKHTVLLWCSNSYVYTVHKFDNIIGYLLRYNNNEFESKIKTS